jgi:hypothetical protein
MKAAMLYERVSDDGERRSLCAHRWVVVAETSALATRTRLHTQVSGSDSPADWWPTYSCITVPLGMC